ncbi:MAG: methylenetetrahydrofolate reductase [Thermoproteota archaeon]|nr:methylenetetrahydrofolate reductase [Thermoproteota archaeon]
MPKLTEIIKEKKFIITLELDPPREPTLNGLIENVKRFEGYVDAVNVSDRKSFLMNSMFVASKIKKLTKMEGIFHLCCRDCNKRSIHSILLAAAADELKNILALSGDKSSRKEQKQSKDVFDYVDSIELIKAIKNMNEGVYPNNEEGEKTDFCIGAAGYPSSPNLEMEIQRLVEKVDSGAEFIQTQPIYSATRFLEYLDATHESGTMVPTLPGMLPLKSRRHALLLEKILGIKISDAIKKRMFGKDVEEGLNILKEVFCEIKKEIVGVHVYSIGDINLALSVVKLLDSVG